MNSALSGDVRPDINGLAQAISHSHAADGLRCQLTPQKWELLANYLQPVALASGQVLIEKGGTDRTVYFVESGTLSAHYQDAKERIRMALLGPGTVIGEGAFFSHQPRCATVQASGLCKLWALTHMRYLELAHRQSALALELTLAMGGVLAKRLHNRPKRVAVT